MAFTKTSWVDGTTAITAAELNRIETGVDEAHGERGSWTPAFLNGTFTYTTQEGKYLRQGPLLTVRFTIAWSAVPTPGTSGTQGITGLPYNPSVDWRGQPAGAFTVLTSGLFVPSGYEDIIGLHLSPQTSYLALNLMRVSGSFTMTSTQNTALVHLADVGQVRGQATFVTDEAFA